MSSDTMNPFKRILHTTIRLLKSNRGETGDGGDGGDGGGDGGAGDGGGGASGTWRDSLPDNLKGNPIFAKYSSANDAHAALVDVQKLIGPEKIIMPSAEADDNEWNTRVFDRLGRPKNAAEYKLPTDLEIPKELPVQERMVQGFREQAHKLGILPKQFAGMYKWFMNEQVTQFNEIKTNTKNNRDVATSKLRTDWGAAFDQNVALGEKVLQTFGDQESIAFLKEKGLSNDPSFIRMLSKIGSAFSEDQLTGKPPSMTKSPEEARAEISKMENDSKHPLFDDKHPEHEAAMKKRDVLYRQAYPNG